MNSKFTIKKVEKQLERAPRPKQRCVTHRVRTKYRRDDAKREIARLAQLV